MKNQNIAFMLKRKELDKVSTEAERISVLKQLAQLNPKDSRDLELRTKYKKELETLIRKGSSKRGHVSDNPYDGLNYDRQVVLVGETNSGRSTLLHRLTGVDVQISESSYTTYKPESGMFVYNDISIQVIEMPPIHPEDNDIRKYIFIRNSDIICITARDEEKARLVQSCLEDRLIIVSGKVHNSRDHKYLPKDEIIEKPSFVASWSDFKMEGLNVVDINSNEGIGSEIYKLLNIQRMYCFKNNQIKGDPVVFPLSQQITVQDFANRLGMKKARSAKIYGPQYPSEGQNVGLSYILSDGNKVLLK